MAVPVQQPGQWAKSCKRAEGNRPLQRYKETSEGFGQVQGWAFVAVNNHGNIWSGTSSQRVWNLSSSPRREGRQGSWKIHRLSRADWSSAREAPTWSSGQACQPVSWIQSCGQPLWWNPLLTNFLPTSQGIPVECRAATVLIVRGWKKSGAAEDDQLWEST